MYINAYTIPSSEITDPPMRHKLSSDYCIEITQSKKHNRRRITANKDWIVHVMVTGTGGETCYLVGTSQDEEFILMPNDARHRSKQYIFPSKAAAVQAISRFPHVFPKVSGNIKFRVVTQPSSLSEGILNFD